MTPKIYTKQGDQGGTSMPSVGKVSKTHERIVAVGDLDELNAHLGMIASFLGDDAKEMVESIQSTLLSIGAEIATLENLADTKAPQSEMAAQLEGAIDGMTAELDPLKNFILPGGTTQSAAVHIARAVCRRAERSLVALGYPVVYINRLSDFLFTLARVVNKATGGTESIWKR